MFYLQNISIYRNFGRYKGERHGTPYIFCLLQKMEKVQEHDQYLYQILHDFDLNFFSYYK